MVRRAARGFLPAADVAFVGPDGVRRPEPAACLVVSSADEARTARANGFDGSIVVLADPRIDDDRQSLEAQGTHFSQPADGPDGLSEVFRDSIALTSDGTPAAIDAAVARTRRLIATGELAAGLRHAMNNPLAALMAEVQLLQLEAHDAETRASAARMLDLVRRLTELTRTLESARDRQPGL